MKVQEIALVNQGAIVMSRLGTSTSSHGRGCSKSFWKKSSKKELKKFNEARIIQPNSCAMSAKVTFAASALDSCS